MNRLFLLTVCFILLSFVSRADVASPATDSDPDMGTAITVIFDNSGSMAGPKIEEAKEAFREWLSKTSDSYTWSLINFDGGGKVIVPFGHNRDQVASAIQGFRAHTNTPIVNALKLAMRQITERRAKDSPYERHLVLLFTDGEENQDPGGDGEVLKIIRKMRAHNIEVVGIGYHGDGDYLGEAATHYYQADDAQALAAGLNKVDAEVDINGEVNVTPEDLKAISELKPPSQPVESTNATDAEITPPPKPRPAKNSLDIQTVLIAFIVFYIIVSVLRRKSRR